MNRPVHFEIHSPDPAASLAFFNAVFGWTSTRFSSASDYHLLRTGSDGPGIDGGLMLSRDGQTRTINTVEVPDVDVHVQKIVAAGGKIALPKMAIPGVGYLAYGMDPTGAIFGIMHTDPSAS